MTRGSWIRDNDVCWIRDDDVVDEASADLMIAVATLMSAQGTAKPEILNHAHQGNIAGPYEDSIGDTTVCPQGSTTEPHVHDERCMLQSIPAQHCDNGVF